MKIYLNTLKCIFITLIPLIMVACGSSDSSNSTNSPSTSQSGSTAAMLPHENALYILDYDKLKVFDISSTEETVLMSENIVSGAETLFVYKTHLYIGGSTGVRIYDIKEPLQPVEVNFYPHARACDPIIIDNDIGYITLRTRPGCQGDVNRLEVVDFSDPSSPVEIAKFSMDFPYGLAKTEKYLAVCQEKYGLSLIDITTDSTKINITAQIKEVANYNEIDCFDLIFSNDILFATATDGIHQFRMDDISLRKVSTIPVGLD